MKNRTSCKFLSSSPDSLRQTMIDGGNNLGSLTQDCLRKSNEACIPKMPGEISADHGHADWGRYLMESTSF